ncbi:hypothetical protein [Vibrio algarum]|uniref:Uncharacterized protein n=1 Tax=Vibrio algarum TaxID=3020714 RepID=A0ABT4YQN7_9VIBR|nr:hypothetical protein [Vibrio sp. KJ40-1]MDB1123790.1 hypothetical protein [Vibrio sp. KJ40-1]
MKDKKDVDTLANSQLFDVLQQGFLAPSTLPSVAQELERIGITADRNSTLFSLLLIKALMRLLSLT